MIQKRLKSNSWNSLESYPKPPRAIVWPDVTDDQVHGEQSFFNTYYDGVCYAPLYIFCGKHLLCQVTPTNVTSRGIDELRRVIQQIRSRWSFVNILVRGDSAYSREKSWTGCESQVGVDYVFGLSQNSRLIKMTLPTTKKLIVMNKTNKQLFPSWKNYFTWRLEQRNRKPPQTICFVSFTQLPNFRILESVPTCGF